MGSQESGTTKWLSQLSGGKSCFLVHSKEWYILLLAFSQVFSHHHRRWQHLLDQSSGSPHSLFSSVLSLSCVWLFATTWAAACQASLSTTNSRSLPKLITTESVIPFNHLILCCPLLLLPSIFPSIRVFSKSQLFGSSTQSIGVSALTSVLTLNT